MRQEDFRPTRRAVLAGLGAMAAPLPAIAEAGPHTRPIPATGERVPAIGMGTWITFNVGDDSSLRAARTEVLQTFFDMGGRVVDSSPMYGSAQAVLGHALARVTDPGRLFSATKVWTPLAMMGDDRRAPDADLPDTGIGLEFERALSSVLIPGDERYGTCSTTVLTVDRKGGVRFQERAFQPGGVPGELREYRFQLEGA